MKFFKIVFFFFFFSVALPEGVVDKSTKSRFKNTLRKAKERTGVNLKRVKEQVKKPVQDSISELRKSLERKANNLVSKKIRRNFETKSRDADRVAKKIVPGKVQVRAKSSMQVYSGKLKDGKWSDASVGHSRDVFADQDGIISQSKKTIASHGKGKVHSKSVSGKRFKAAEKVSKGRGEKEKESYFYQESDLADALGQDDFYFNFKENLN